MSSLADPVSRPQRRTITIPLPRVAGNGVLATSVAVAIAGASFMAAGGLRLERTTNVLIAMILGSAVIVVAALLQRPWTADAPLYGGAALLAFGALAVLTALSVLWSLAPADSWVEAGRTFAYLSLFAAGLALARLMPQRWAALLAGVAGGCLIVCGWALLTKVFPASLAGEETYARLREPFAYWNSVGVMAAMGVLPLLWLAARRSGHAAFNALAWPGIGLLLVCMMLSYSRGALVALLLGLAVWFLIVPLRLRGVVSLAACVLGAAPVIAWAFSQDGLTTDRAPIAARVDAGHEFGALLLLMAAVLLVAGLAVQFAAAQRPPTPRERRLAGRGALAVLALVPVVALVALAIAPGGVDGQVSKAWNQLTDPNAKTPSNEPGRFTETSSVRARYWREALDIHATEPLLGSGAGAYATVRTRFRDDTLVVRHAHGYVVQTLADLGWIGLAAVAAGGARLALRRPAGDRPVVPRSRPAVRRRADRDADAVRRGDRVRRPLGGRLDLVRARQRRRRRAVRRLGRRPRSAARPAGGARRAARPCRAGVAARQPARAARPAHPAAARARPSASCSRSRSRRRGARTSPCGPCTPATRRSTGSTRASPGRPPTSPASPPSATRSPSTRCSSWPRSSRRAAAPRRPRRALAKAVEIQPASAEAWRRLGRLRLDVLNDPQGALSAFQAAYYLDPRSPASDLGRDRGQPRRPGGHGRRRLRAPSPCREPGAQERRAAPRAHRDGLEARLAQRRARATSACRSAGAGRAGRSARRSARPRSAPP